MARLHTREVPGLPLPGDADPLQFLRCPFDARGEDRAVAVCLRWRKAADVSEVPAEQPEPEAVGRAEYVPDSCMLHPEQVTKHQWEDLPPYPVRARLDEWEEREDAVSCRFGLSVSPGWKVGGFAAWPTTGRWRTPGRAPADRRGARRTSARLRVPHRLGPPTGPTRTGPSCDEPRHGSAEVFRQPPGRARKS